jgi:CDP-diacylglycerol--glycerol-3-phosphate 3-phosphatidyltransferase
MKKEREDRERFWNIPNPISTFRIIISPILVLLVYYNINIFLIAVLFIIAALSDFADGFIARKYDQVTKLGRKLDMIADRILMISLVLALLVYAYHHDFVNNISLSLVALLMTREIFSAFLLVIAFFKKKSRLIPHARFAGKLTTTLQGFAFPMILFGWSIALYFAIATAIAGFVCACYYAYDALINPNNSFQKKMDLYYEKLEG